MTVWAKSNAIVHGLISGHMLPTKAAKKPNPTHQITHTETGVIFLNVLGLPNSPASTSNVSAAIDSACKLATRMLGIGTVKITPSDILATSLLRKNIAPIFKKPLKPPLLLFDFFEQSD